MSAKPWVFCSWFHYLAFCWFFGCLIDLCLVTRSILDLIFFFSLLAYWYHILAKFYMYFLGMPMPRSWTYTWPTTLYLICSCNKSHGCQLCILTKMSLIWNHKGVPSTVCVRCLMWFIFFPVFFLSRSILWEHPEVFSLFHTLTNTLIVPIPLDQ